MLRPSSKPQPTLGDLLLYSAPCLWLATSWFLEMNGPLPIPVLVNDDKDP